MDHASRPVPHWVQVKMNQFCSTLLRSTVSFFGYQNEAMIQAGSGVLLRIADSLFVLTADHVLHPVMDHEIPMFVGVGPMESIGIPLSSLGVIRADDPYDLAIVEFRPETYEQLSNHNRFITLAEFDVTRSFSPDQCFLVFGYPLVNSGCDPESKVSSAEAFGYITGLYPGDRGKVPKHIYQDENHLLFDFSEGIQKDETGKAIPLPHPKGISGCGVWRIARPDLPIDKWEPDDLQLVAIEHALLPETRALIGTRIQFALGLIRKHRPELRPAIGLTFPSLP